MTSSPVALLKRTATATIAVIRSNPMLVRNYLAHSIEGGIFVGGLAFISFDSVLPRLTELLGGPAWVIALMPVMMYTGFGIPSLFVAHRIEQLDRMKPIVVITGIFMRLPFLAGGLMLWFGGEEFPALALTAVALAPLLTGLCGGISYTAWLELISRQVPEHLRSSLFAFRNIVSAVVGIGAGIAVRYTLHRMPGVPGYSILFFCAFLATAVSMGIFLLNKEPDFPRSRKAPSRNLLQNLGAIPGIFSSDRRFLRFVVSRTLGVSVLIIQPFVAVHALRLTGKPDAFLGTLVSVQMTGMILGNMCAGVIGDRYGGKRVLLISRSVLAVAVLWCCIAQSPLEFTGIFFLFGVAIFAARIADITLNIEISPAPRRATYLAIVSFIGVISMLSYSLFGATLWKAHVSFAAMAGSAATLLVMSVALLRGLTDPRERRRRVTAGDAA